MQPRKYILAVLLPAVMAGNGLTQDPVKMTLKQCIETGIANNLDVLQSDLQMQASEISWKQSRLDLLPNLNAFANHGINQGRSIDPFTNGYVNQQINYASYGISSGVILFNGLSLMNTVRENSLAFQASKMDFQQAKDNLTINIILAYLQVLSGQDLVDQAQNQAELSRRQVERLDLLNKEGAISPSQYYDLKGQLANDELAIINNKNNLETAKLDLCRYMNIAYDPAMEFEKIDAESYAVAYEDTPGKIYQTSMEKFALIKSVDLRQQSAEKALRARRGNLFPILSLNGNANTNYSSAATQSTFINSTEVTSDDYVLVNGSPSNVIQKQNNYSTSKISYNDQVNNNLFSSLSLNLSIPIFNSLRARNRVKLAKLDLKNTEIIASSTKTQLKQNIEQSYINMTSASERFKTLLDQVNSFTKSFKAAEVRFNAGVGTSIDYLTAKNNLDRSTINLITARYDYVLRTKILDYYQGKPLW